MSNEQMDALFRKVFGDGEVGDDQILNSASASLVGEETLLTNLRRELSGLGDVPECQLNSARLKDAILNSSAAKPQWFVNWWKVALPVAACGAFAMFLMNLDHSPTQISPKGDFVAGAQNVVPTPKFSDQADPAAMSKELIEEKADEVVVPTKRVVDAPQESDSVAAPVVQRARPVRKSPRRSSAPQFASAAPVAGGGGSMSNASADQIGSTIATEFGMSRSENRTAAVSGAVSSIASGALVSFSRRSDGVDMASAMSASAVGSPGSTTVVIVGAGRDPETRASTATEVDKKNVVFGG